MTVTLDDIIANFELLEEWDDRYRYLIELGRELEPLPDPARTDANKVRGCASQVWLVSKVVGNGEKRLIFRGDSDAHIVRGLIAILLSLYSGRSAQEIVETDPEAVFARIGLRDHLTSQRSNGLSSMLARIRSDAQRAFDAP